MKSLPFVALASQKNRISLYLMRADDGGATMLAREIRRGGKKLDIGKASIRLRALEDFPLMRSAS
jgi:hypothetical protein